MLPILNGQTCGTEGLTVKVLGRFCKRIDVGNELQRV